VSSNGSTAHGLCQAPTKRNGGEAQSNDIGLALAEEHGVEVYTSIREALCCNHGPGGELAVDGVILVGEHGDCELLTTTARLHHHLPAHSLTHSLHSAATRHWALAQQRTAPCLLQNVRVLAVFL
jgi:hypothetical protein